MALDKTYMELLIAFFPPKQCLECLSRYFKFLLNRSLKKYIFEGLKLDQNTEDIVFMASISNA